MFPSPKKRRAPNQAGQALPLSLVCLMILCIFVVLMVKAGHLVLEKERARSRTDAVAYSAGVDYARCLNVLSLSNKLWAAAWAIKILSLVPVPGLQEILAAAPSPGSVQKVQDVFAGTGSLGNRTLQAGTLVEGSCLAVAFQNGLVASPILWNQGEDGKASLLPALNLRRRYFSELGKDEKKLFEKLGAKGGDRYSYKPKGGDKRVDVDPSQVITEEYGRKNGRRQKVYRTVDANGRSIFLKHTPGDLPWDLVETGPHNLVVWTYQPAPAPASLSSWMPQGGILSVSKVEVGGGSMAVFDLNGANYGAYLVPCRPEADPGTLPALAVLGLTEILH